MGPTSKSDHVTLISSRLKSPGHQMIQFCGNLATSKLTRSAPGGRISTFDPPLDAPGSELSSALWFDATRHTCERVCFAIGKETNWRAPVVLILVSQWKQTRTELIPSKFRHQPLFQRHSNRCSRPIGNKCSTISHNHYSNCMSTWTNNIPTWFNNIPNWRNNIPTPNSIPNWFYNILTDLYNIPWSNRFPKWSWLGCYP